MPLPCDPSLLNTASALCPNPLLLLQPRCDLHFAGAKLVPVQDHLKRQGLGNLMHFSAVLCDCQECYE